MSHLLQSPCISPARIGPTRSGARTHHCATVASAPAHRLEPPRVAPGRGAAGAPVVRCPLHLRPSGRLGWRLVGGVAWAVCLITPVGGPQLRANRTVR